MINIKELCGLGYYMSELDSFIAAFDKKNQRLSESQRKEKMKYDRIFTRNGTPQPGAEKNKLWENF